MVETLSVLRGNATASGSAAANHLSPECFWRVSRSTKSSFDESLRWSKVNVFKTERNWERIKVFAGAALPSFLGTRPVSAHRDALTKQMGRRALESNLQTTRPP